MGEAYSKTRTKRKEQAEEQEQIGCLQNRTKIKRTEQEQNRTEQEQNRTEQEQNRTEREQNIT